MFSAVSSNAMRMANGRLTGRMSRTIIFRCSRMKAKETSIFSPSFRFTKIGFSFIPHLLSVFHGKDDEIDDDEGKFQHDGGNPHSVRQFGVAGDEPLNESSHDGDGNNAEHNLESLLGCPFERLCSGIGFRKEPAIA